MSDARHILSLVGALQDHRRGMDADTPGRLWAEIREALEARDAEIATLRGLLAESRPYVAHVQRLGVLDVGAWESLISRIDAALSPTVPTRPDLSPSKSPPPSEDSGGVEMP